MLREQNSLGVFYLPVNVWLLVLGEGSFKSFLKKKRYFQNDTINSLVETNNKMDCFDDSDIEDEVSIEGLTIDLRELVDIETKSWI